jgi:hypothetical protein
VVLGGKAFGKYLGLGKVFEGRGSMMRLMPHTKSDA